MNRVEQCLELIRANPGGISRGEIAQKMGIRPGTVSVYVDELRKFGVAKPTGIGRYSRWVPCQKPKAARSVFDLGKAA